MSSSAGRSPSVNSFSQSSRTAQQPANSASKPADYVYFDRSTAAFSDNAVPRSKGAQLKLEHYYKVVVDAAIERNTRYVCTPHHARRLVQLFPDVSNSNVDSRVMS